MNIVLLGASGFVGGAVLHRLLKIEGVNITCTTRTLAGKNTLSHSRLHWVELDLLDLLDLRDPSTSTTSLKALLLQSDVVINCVGELTDLTKMHDVNVKLVKRLVDWLLQAQKKTHLIQLSSVGCYGAVTHYRGKKVTISETSKERPIGEYEQTKTEADNYIRENIPRSAAEQSGLMYTLIRPTNVFGDTMRSDALKGLAGAVASAKFFYIGHKNSLSTYVNVDDVAQLIELCIYKQAQAKNQTFIVSDDTPQQNVINAFADYFKVTRPRWVAPEWVIRALSSVIIKCIPSFPLTSSRIDSLTSQVAFSNAKAKSVLGFEAKKSLDKQANTLLDHWFSNAKN